MSLIYGIKWPGSLFGADGVTRAREHRDHAGVRAQARPGVRLGTCKPGQTVMTSRDTHPASRVMNRCIISGLLSVGVNVQDLRSYAAAARRATPCAARGDGGIHTCAFRRTIPNAFLIEFFDQHGDQRSTRTTERKIENLFFREDFRRTPMDGGRQPRLSRRACSKRYTDAFLEALVRAAMSRTRASGRHRLRVRQRVAHPAAHSRAISASSMIALNAYFDDAAARTFRATTASAISNSSQRHDVARRRSRHSARPRRRNVRAGRRPRPHRRGAAGSSRC